MFCIFVAAIAGLTIVAFGLRALFARLGERLRERQASAVLAAHRVTLKPPVTAVSVEVITVLARQKETIHG